MKFKYFLLIILFISILNSLLYPSKSLASWAYSFVVWDGYTYVVSDEYVTEIDKEIGHVTKYSDREGTYSGNFSNAYKKGTKYYSIEGISTEEAIAIQEQDGQYKKAIRNGKYAGNKYTFFGLGFPMLFIILSIFFMIVIIGVYKLEQKVQR